jgi:acyl dehydratase
MSEHRIDHDRSQLFARLSGDFNMQHLDVVEARRLTFGTTVVHGVHIVCHGLDHWLQSEPAVRLLQKLRVSFTNPLRQGEGFTLRTERTETTTQIFAENTFGQVCSIVAEWSTSAVVPHDQIALDQAFEPAAATRLDEADLAHAAGDIPLLLDDGLAASLFPTLLRHVGRDQLSAILASTLLVGMLCPGDRSIFKYLSLAFVPQTPFAPSLRYSVARYDQKSALMSLSLQNPAVKGNVHAIVRALPVAQPRFEDLATLVAPDRFAGQTTLVLGGSRGMGEVAAKLAAAGGASVIITYAQGQADAERVAGEIIAAGGSARTVRADVTVEQPVAADADLLAGVTHVYFFATPKINFNVKPQIHRGLLATYLEYYVFGLERLLLQLTAGRKAPDHGITLFLPSTIFISEPKAGTFEYAGAKAMAEVFAHYSSEKFGIPISIVMPRIPMTLTDQTSNVDQELPRSSDILIDLLPVQ